MISIFPGGVFNSVRTPSCAKVFDSRLNVLSFYVYSYLLWLRLEPDYITPFSCDQAFSLFVVVVPAFYTVLASNEQSYGENRLRTDSSVFETPAVQS